MKPKVLIGHALKSLEFKANFPHLDIDCIPDNDNKYETIKSMISDYDGLLAISHPVDSGIIEQASQLKIVANCAVGYDNIDVESAKKLNIAVSNTPDSTTASTADFTLGLIISVLRKISMTDRWVREAGKIPKWGHRSVMGQELGGKKLGIIGLGRIGKAVAQRAQAFGIEVLYYKRNQLHIYEEAELLVHYNDFEEIFRNSDIISIHTPLNEESFGMIGCEEFELMKPGSFFINTSRGPVVNESELIEALLSGHLAGAGLDVFEHEPNIPEALLEMDNVVLAPHNGTGTMAARDAMFSEALGNISAFLTGGEMTSRIV